MALRGNAKSCRHCGQAGVYGGGCPYSPHGKHEAVPTDGKACVFCGKSAYGKGCPFGASNLHIHGSDGERCRYCGSKSLGRGCPYSPNGAHER